MPGTAPIFVYPFSFVALREAGNMKGEMGVEKSHTFS
jgi:hypothetical protein